MPGRAPMKDPKSKASQLVMDPGAQWLAYVTRYLGVTDPVDVANFNASKPPPVPANVVGLSEPPLMWTKGNTKQRIVALEHLSMEHGMASRTGLSRIAKSEEIGSIFKQNKGIR